LLLQKGPFLRLLEQERETWGKQRADGAAWETGGGRREESEYRAGERDVEV
jgi:hypothetical protein